MDRDDLDMGRKMRAGVRSEEARHKRDQDRAYAEAATSPSGWGIYSGPAFDTVQPSIIVARIMRPRAPGQFNNEMLLRYDPAERRWWSPADYGFIVPPGVAAALQPALTALLAQPWTDARIQDAVWQKLTSSKLKDRTSDHREKFVVLVRNEMRRRRGGDAIPFRAKTAPATPAPAKTLRSDVMLREIAKHITADTQVPFVVGKDRHTEDPYIEAEYGDYSRVYLTITWDREMEYFRFSVNGGNPSWSTTYRPSPGETPAMIAEAAMREPEVRKFLKTAAAKLAPKTTADLVDTKPAALVLAAAGNPDYPAGHELRTVRISARTVPVTSWEDASKRFENFISTEGLGSGNLTREAGTVTNRAGVKLGRISYNGRAWDMHDQEIPIEQRITPRSAREWPKSEPTPTPAPAPAPAHSLATAASSPLDKFRTMYPDIEIGRVYTGVDTDFVPVHWQVVKSPISGLYAIHRTFGYPTIYRLPLDLDKPTDREKIHAWRGAKRPTAFTKMEDVPMPRLVRDVAQEVYGVRDDVRKENQILKYTAMALLPEHKVGVRSQSPGSDYIVIGAEPAEMTPQRKRDINAAMAEMGLNEHGSGKRSRAVVPPSVLPQVLAMAGGAPEPAPTPVAPASALAMTSPTSAQPEELSDPLAADIPRSIAQASHSGTSYSHELRAQQEIVDYVRHLRSLKASLDALAKTPEQQAEAAAQFERYREGFRSRTRERLTRRSGLVSTMIAGPSKFPVASQSKKSDAYDRKNNELWEWVERAQAAAQKAVRAAAPGGDPTAPISSDDENAIGKLKAKLAKLQEFQTYAVTANKIVRRKISNEAKIEALGQELGMSAKTAASLLEPDYGGRIGIPSYELTNNNANIKRIEGRIADLERAAKDTTREAELPGGITVTDDVEDNRLRITFPGKPDSATISALKSNGFKWAPSVGAWQRQRGPNALYGAKLALGVDVAAALRGA